MPTDTAPPVKRPVVGFHRDHLGEFVAVLGCGHEQHVRHRPPWTSHAWVTTAEGRAAKIGQEFDCFVCAELDPGRG